MMVTHDCKMKFWNVLFSNAFLALFRKDDKFDFVYDFYATVIFLPVETSTEGRKLMLVISRTCIKLGVYSLKPVIRT